MRNILFRFLALALLAAAPAAAQEVKPRPVPYTSDEAITQDASEYSRRVGIAADEAARRLRAQEESVAATDTIAARYKRRLAGISIEHSPDFRIHVLLTGRKKVPDEIVFAGGMPVPIVYRTGAGATREEVIAAIRRHAAAIRKAHPTAQGMGLDQRTGELTVMIRGQDAARNDPAAIEARIEALTGVPVRVRVMDGSVVNAAGGAAVEGGVRVAGADALSGRRNVCTTGFVVTDGARTGIVTAAHCPDTLSYIDPQGGGEVTLEFGGQWGWSYQDVQLHVSEAAQQPVFYADPGTAPRLLGGQRRRESTRAGDAVCHRGVSSGYSCSFVELTDYAPPGELCGGPCDAVWVTVAGPNCRGGDSGGPVFSGATAFGITKGATYDREGRCNFYFYMSTDYLPEGWTLLRGPATPMPSDTAAALR
ncbi:MAG TPA: hypothetical protein VEZ70_08515 [Allosphingosinicella sp.]|nr:hypothetical protein [Allosphingosinicella sp.]